MTGRPKTGIKRKFMLFVLIIALSIMAIGIGMGYYWAINLLTVTVVKSHTEMAEQLSASLNRILTEEIEDIQEGFKYIRRSKKDWRIQMPDDDKKWMLNFFTPNKSSKWPIFINSKYNIFNCKI